MNCVLRHLFPLLLGAGCALRPAGSVGPVASPGEKALEIIVLDVGHGDATLVRSPRGDTLLIDGGPVGPQTADLLATLRRWDALPPDHMIVTHRDPAHLGGIVFLLSGPDAQPGTDDDLKLRGVLLDSGPDFGCSALECVGYGTLAQKQALRARVGDTVDLGGGARARVVATGGAVTREGAENAVESDGRSIAVLLEFHDFRFLVAGDLPSEVEDRLAASLGRVDVLRVSGHGTDASTSAAWLGALRPQIAVVSVGENEACLPTAATSDRLATSGAQIWFTRWPQRARGCGGADLPPGARVAGGNLRIQALRKETRIWPEAPNGRPLAEPIRLPR